MIRFLLLIVCGLFGVIGARFLSDQLLEKPTIQHPHFYDGEGDEIPYHAVNDLVQAQFVHVNKQQQDTIDKYFKLK